MCFKSSFEGIAKVPESRMEAGILFQVAGAKTGNNNFSQIVNTHRSVSPCSIIWYWSKGSDILRLGR